MCVWNKRYEGKSQKEELERCQEKDISARKKSCQKKKDITGKRRQGKKNIQTKISEEKETSKETGVMYTERLANMCIYFIYNSQEKKMSRASNHVETKSFESGIIEKRFSWFTTEDLRKYDSHTFKLQIIRTVHKPVAVIITLVHLFPLRCQGWGLHPKLPRPYQPVLATSPGQWSH